LGGEWSEERRGEFRRRLAQAVKDGGGAVRLGDRLGIAKSTIYNWLNGTVGDPPASAIEQIAGATGYDRDWIMAVDMVPAFGKFSEDAVPFVGASRAWSKVAPADGGRWTVATRALELAGVLPGDLADFDFSVPPRPGDVVIAQLYAGDGSARTVLRLWRPPVLLVATADAAIDQAPIPIDETGGAVNVRGPMVRLLRERR
jgi:transcriptional regulator with XRE-family HTH domain